MVCLTPATADRPQREDDTEVASMSTPAANQRVAVAEPARRVEVPAPGRTAVRSGRFPAVVLASSPEQREQLATALHAVGASNVVLAESPDDLLTKYHLPQEPGVGAICMAPQDGSVLQLVTDLRRRGWRRLVMISRRDDENSVRLAIAAKVRCFVGQPEPAGNPAVAAPEVIGSPGLRELSEREIEVLQQVADGNTNKEAGQNLGLSGLTVKSHLARIGRKLGTGDRAEMVALAMRAGLIH